MKKTPRLIITFTLMLLFVSLIALIVRAESSSDTSLRLAGSDRYLTAIQISQAGWSSSANVVLARGDNFPDALAGAVLARKIKAPLLLTESSQLRPEVEAELQRLEVTKVYLLGAQAALSPAIESRLTDLSINFQRLQGADRYGTAADIARITGAPDAEAFLVTGYQFADALSISSYAAAHNIPILLTDLNSLPGETVQILKELKIKNITIIGGPGAVSLAVENSLKESGYIIERIQGADRYETNINVIQTLKFNRTGTFFATGENYPDALAGAVLASEQNQPIFLIRDKQIPDQTLAYLNTLRPQIQQFTVFGGYALIPYGTESILRTGSLNPRISLQYWQAYNYEGYQNELQVIPGNAAAVVDFVAPNWYCLNNIPSGQTAADGSFSGNNAFSDNDYVKLVKAAHTRGLKVLPIIASSWNNDGKAALDSMLADKNSRTNLINGLTEMIRKTGSDGVVLDFEYLSDTSGPNLTQFTKELGAQLKAQNKILVMAVMARTSSTDWYPEFDYPRLAQNVDYLNIMTYDYSTSVPGPIAPLDWIKKVLVYTKSQGVAMNKVLLGIPYYGRDWTETPSGYQRASVSLSTALKTSSDYKAALQRLTSSSDSTGIPYYTYTDTAGAAHTVYYDDPQSWEAKLSLLDQYNLGGIGSWSLMWLDSDTAAKLFPILQRHLR
ncbi:MAG: cell wall-binding repeat-containing protein [Desulfitobacteriaceae bacterium]|nr:cell wall-binding repeat-containing protein [Desulfitobacteriaceae bacterium]MDD4401018.1 cell wall-binding repeat-containing protein [Desulfitobacteriaceae bacterium]